jgi:hypothetical protein
VDAVPKGRKVHMKWSSRYLGILVLLVVVSGATRAQEEYVFPVGIWLVEGEEGASGPFDLPAERVVDLRSKGVEMILLSGRYSGKSWLQVQGNIWFDTVMVDVNTLRGKLARADSFGFLVYADPKSIDETMKYWGHYPPDVFYPYFRYDRTNLFSSQAFNDTLDSLVSWVVDSLNSYLQVNDIQSLYRYIFWDEPFSHHLRWLKTGDSLDDYYDNIWEHDDTTGFDTDSLSVGTFLKHKIESKDTLHSVWLDLWGCLGKESGPGSLLIEGRGCLKPSSPAEF